MRHLTIICLYLLTGIIAAQPAVANGYLLDVKVFLQGAYPENAPAHPALMRDTLREKRLIPAEQPFNRAPYYYAGDESFSEALFDVTGNSAIVDWVLVELRDPADLNLVVARRAVLLNRLGYIVSVSGQNGLYFDELTENSYYVVLHHRNHLSLMTASPAMMRQDYLLWPASVDFTDSTVSVLPANGRKIVQNTADSSPDSIALMLAGDINSDAKVSANGPANDSTDILSAVLADEANTDLNTNYRKPGYADSDLDMDGFTTFSGPGNDPVLLLSNILLHPQNVNIAANFIIRGLE